MKKSVNPTRLFLLLATILVIGCSPEQAKEKGGNLKIGWASRSITPDQPVFLSGQFYARISEGILDPVMATALAMESDSGNGVIMVSCDLVSIENELRESVLLKMKQHLPEFNVNHLMINATHSHSAPFATAQSISDVYGVDQNDLGSNVMAPEDYVEFAAERIAEACVEAWKGREISGVSYGLGHAVVGQNRLAVYEDGSARMYGNFNDPDFSHVEGYEDHSVNLIYCFNTSKELTGVVINVACPSQVSEHIYQVSADFWSDVREKIHEEFGRDIFVLAQGSSAGDQSPRAHFQANAEERMQKIMGLDADGAGQQSLARRKQLAIRIVDAVLGVYPYMEDQIEWSPEFGVTAKNMSLTRRLISQEDVDYAVELAKEHADLYEKAKIEMETNDKLKEDPRWYKDVTGMYRRLQRGDATKERFELQKIERKIPFHIMVVRLGEVAIASNPFELYVDYGIRIKARSPAVQTFLVQLSDSKGMYLPPKRSVKGNAYGAIPASTLIGPEGGKELVEGTLEMINSLWKEEQ
ncbi:MAG: hypothetical protein WD431_19725 [Cyclobacteriaceae bacterium]